MVAKDLIATQIPALDIVQTGKDAFQVMAEHHVKHLPVVDGAKLVGIISEDDIFNHSLYEPLESYDFSMLRRFSVRSNDHFFEVIRIMGENQITVIPVENEEGLYVGLVSQSKILHAFSQTTTFAEPGAVLVLSMKRAEYSLGTISRIAEQEDVHILSSFVSSRITDELLEVTLKLRTQDLSRVVSSYMRHGYVVNAAFMEAGYSEMMRSHYDSLMRYLEV